MAEPQREPLEFFAWVAANRAMHTARVPPMDVTKLAEGRIPEVVQTGFTVVNDAGRRVDGRQVVVVQGGVIVAAENVMTGKIVWVS